MAYAIKYMPGSCPECGQSFEQSSVTYSRFDTFGLAPSDALAYFSEKYDNAGGMHLHGVTIASLDALTVRGSLKRWGHHARARAAWRVRTLLKSISRFPLGE